MSEAWTLTVDDQSVAWLTFDLPGEKVNKLTASAMAQLSELLDGQPGDGAKALVIRSSKRDSFIVGADIGELAAIKDESDAARKAELGRAVFDKLAALSIPTVAVINGACLGGGLELALACRYRLVTDHPKTSLGLPEVNLGIIPGWGGTQRLPRLIGLAAGLKMILTGKPVDGRRAYKMGLADGMVAPAFLEEQTARFVQRILQRTGRRDVARRRRRRQPRLMRWLAATPMGRWLIYKKSVRQVERQTHGNYPAPVEALGVVQRTFHKHRPSAEGGAVETEAFSRLACTPVSRNLLWLFEASQRMKKGAGRGAAKLKPARAAGVVGAGIMGSGIAWALSNAGVRVRLKDMNWEVLAQGMAAAAGMYRALVKRRKMTEGQMNLAMHRISPTTGDTGLGNADVAIEAVIEDLEIKKKVLRHLEQLVPAEALICTNTSSLSLEELAGALERPRRFIGLHFFNPVNRMPLVEVVPCGQTAPEMVIAAAELVRQMGKTPIIVGDCAGFLVNRILLPYLIESAWMFEEGVEPSRIDQVLERFGMPMGPLALADEVGLDVGYKVAKELEAAYGERMHVPGAFGAVATSDSLGKKTGSGFYRYRNGHKKPNTKVARLARQARKDDGVRARELSDDQIVDRAILIMVNEAARCLEEGVVDNPESLDMAMVMGTGFAPFRGGLLRYADERGVDQIKTRLDELAESFGGRFKPAPLIEQIAGNGGHFYQAPRPHEDE